MPTQSFAFAGIVPPVCTIFAEDGRFDPEGQALLIERLIAAGVDGLFVCGTGGEFSQMTTAERMEVAEFAVLRAAKRTKVLVGVGSNNPREAAELTRHAESIGADGIVAVNPSYWKLSESNLFAYFAGIANATHLPVLLYNFPLLTGQDLTPAFVKAVALKHENVVGIKETIDSIGHIRTMINTVCTHRPEFSVFCGYDDHLLTTLMLGGAGAISASGNFAPELSTRIHRSFRDGDLGTAARLHMQLAQVAAMYALDAPFVNVVKEAIRLCGLAVSSHCLPPTARLDDDTIAEIAAILRRAKLLD
jgi:2-dehydro-3-deoxy-D-pentonate aldolase